MGFSSITLNYCIVSETRLPHRERVAEKSISHPGGYEKSTALFRDKQKVASREKRGSLMSQLNSHQKTMSTWILLCAKAENTYTLKGAILGSLN